MNTMNVILKNVCKLIVVLLLCLLPFLLPAAENHQWEIELNIGTTYSGINHFNDTMNNLGWNISGEKWKYIHWSINTSAEIVYRLNKKYGISVGTGFLQFKGKPNDGIFFVDWVVSGFNTRIQYVPIALNLLYTLPVGEKLRFIMSAGPGLYLGRFSIKNELIMIDGPHAGEIKAHGPALGGQAAIALEMDLDSHIALILKINSHMVRFAKMMKNVESIIDGRRSRGGYINLPDYIDLSGVGVCLGMKMFL